MDGKHAHRLVEHADTWQLQAPAMLAERLAQLLVDQRIEDGPAVAFDRLHQLLDLPRCAHQRPDMLLDVDTFILHEAGAGHARHGFTGGVRHAMDVEIAVGHEAILLHTGARTNVGLSEATRGQKGETGGSAGFGNRTINPPRLWPSPSTACGEQSRNYGNPHAPQGLLPTTT